MESLRSPHSWTLCPSSKEQDLTIEEEVEAIVNESGNSFHCRVANYLQAQGWHIQVSPYYMDSSTNKPREIDIIAEKAWSYNDKFEGIHGTINIKLFIECKYIPNTNVFWFGAKDMASSREWLERNTPLERENHFLNMHHYVATNPEIAKLFSSKNRPNTENEVIYKALNQSLNSMVYLRHRESIIPAPNDRHPNVLANIEMPVIACNSFDKFYRTNMNDDAAAQKIEDNFQLEVNYAYVDQAQNNQNEFFLIDVVDFNQIDNFLSLIEADKDALFQVIR
jgi:hypothetical protein